MSDSHLVHAQTGQVGPVGSSHEALPGPGDTADGGPGGPGPGGMGPFWAPPQPPGRRRGLTIAAAVAAFVVAAAAGAGISHLVWTSPSSSANSNAQGSSGNQNPGLSPFGSGATGGSNSNVPAGSGAPADVNSIAAKADPALVDINSTFSYQSDAGAGTGIVLTSTGEILTNNHVIDGATKISVTDVGNGQTYNASVVGYDSTHDIAVLQLQGASGLKTATLGDSSKVSVGTSVVAIGNAGGTGGTPTSAGGSVTATNQSIAASDELGGTTEQLSGLIQVNADVQSGDSGGALVNSSGQVIGMDTAASSGFNIQSSGNQGYAIPIAQASATARQIEAGTASSTVHIGATAFLGVLIDSSSSGLGSGVGGSQGLGGSTSGAVVSSVVNGGTAAQAGITSGDVITSLGGQAVNSASDLTHLMFNHRAGDNVQIGWTDTSGQSHTAAVVLGSGPPA